MAGADYDRRWLLGDLLKRRRAALGYAYRPSFTRDRVINDKMVQDVENANRDTFTYPALQNIARAYDVTYDSMIAVVRGTADELAPPPAAPPAILPAPPAADDPPFDAPRAEQNRPFFDPINERRVELATRGIAYPDGAQMFGEGTEDAKAWDTDGAPMPVGDRVWFIADLRRRAAGRAAGSQAGDRGA